MAKKIKRIVNIRLRPDSAILAPKVRLIWRSFLSSSSVVALELGHNRKSSSFASVRHSPPVFGDGVRTPMKY